MSNILGKAINDVQGEKAMAYYQCNVCGEKLTAGEVAAHDEGHFTEEDQPS